ncbi:hypothetical protein HDV00_005696 [Rhizophlyctis rosea]|nr:hypothetical protein HDV00_005696 [Rhizophlyctis rosea]
MDLWIEIPALLRSPINVFNTNRFFRSLGKDFHTRCRYLCNRHGTRPALLYAVQCHCRLLSPTLITLLLQAGASLPRCVMQDVVKSSTTDTKYAADVVIAILLAGHQTYGNNLQLNRNDSDDFANAVQPPRYEINPQSKETRIKLIRDLITTYGFIPTSQEGIQDLATSDNEEEYKAFLLFQSAGFNCTKFIAQINDKVMLQTLMYRHNLKDIQRLLDRGFELTTVATTILKDSHRFLPCISTSALLSRNSPSSSKPKYTSATKSKLRTITPTASSVPYKRNFPKSPTR